MSKTNKFKSIKDKVEYYSKLQNKLFPKLGIYISNDSKLNNLDKVISNESYIIVGYDDYGKKPHKFLNNGNGITYTQIFEWLKETQYKPKGDHKFLEDIVKQSKHKYWFWYGS